VLWFAAYNVLLNAAEQHIDAGTASMLVNVGPILIALLAGVVLGEAFPRTLFAGGLVAQKVVLARVSALQTTWLCCVVGAVVCLPFAPSLASDLGDADASSLAWLVYLGVFPTAVAFTTWAFALARTGAARLAPLTYLVPPISVLLGWGCSPRRRPRSHSLVARSASSASQ
ncbi:MAG TPA: DMT family transporter, partial [Gaiellaceae bacterium]|nr:DMT family transporter [Gaiellaceae bacterium]